MEPATATPFQQVLPQRQPSGFGKFLKWAGMGFGGLVGLIILLIIIGVLIGDEQPEAATSGAAPQAALAPTATLAPSIILAPSITVTAVELSELYGSNKVAAQNLYTGKIARITGEVGPAEKGLPWLAPSQLHRSYKTWSPRSTEPHTCYNTSAPPTDLATPATFATSKWMCLSFRVARIGKTATYFFKELGR